ncbi:MRN complex-interacting protein [Neocloeon triangulifer]|uniref:MRN complex-interacting protein n=1 Tax=Neocloeon triangulifer TaxID=2078957 RepID=UPI00286EF36E|nr:MRN complex-interacting protein [Neocloeon triangulifer]
MPQEFHVLRCFACSTFQVHIVKKSSNKWQCKMCNEKQSIKQVFGRGTGQECRVHVQKLNASRITSEEMQNSHCTEMTLQKEDLVYSEVQQFDPFNQPFQPQTSESKWSNFLQVDKEESSDDEDPIQMALRASDPRRVRKAKPRAPKPALANAEEEEENCSSSRKRTSNFNAEAKEVRVEGRRILTGIVAENKPSKWSRLLPNDQEDEEELQEQLVQPSEGSSKWGKFSHPNESKVFEFKPKTKVTSKWDHFTTSETSSDIETLVESPLEKSDPVPSIPQPTVSQGCNLKKATTPTAKKQRAIDFVLDETVDDDELDALLTL